MLGLLVITLVLAVPNAFLLRWILQKRHVTSWGISFLIALGIYVANAFLVGAVLVFWDTPDFSPRELADTAGKWLIFSVYGILMFAVVYVPILAVLAHIFRVKED